MSLPNHKLPSVALGTTNRALVLTSICLWACLSLASSAHAEPQQARLFSQPPAPQTLAAQLFGPRYRSGSLQTGLFGMLVQFEFGSDALLPSSLPLLDSVGEMMLLPEAQGRSIIVEGHTDTVGSQRYNQTLSERRARAVVDYLANTFDLSPSRFSSTGKGETQLHDQDNPAAAVNRRAVFRASQKIKLK